MPPTDSPTEVLSKGAATRQRILVCAVSRFATEGFRQASVAGIARDAGVTAPAVHAYFGSKEELFRVAFEHDIAGFLDVVKGRLTEPTFPAGNADLIPALLGELETHPLARRIFQGLEADRTAELLRLPAVEQVREEMVRVVTDRQAEGALRADLPAQTLAGALEVLVLALLLGATQVGLIGDEQRRLAILAVLKRGIGA
ncbi:MAG: TetR/AcrR family transcriptional regulator [Micromonosporaceae bacterium]|nr:TetR/AcrR family transcriptional regulator [Micromonosporaceae bacterium]